MVVRLRDDDRVTKIVCKFLRVCERSGARGQKKGREPTVTARRGERPVFRMESNVVHRVDLFAAAVTLEGEVLRGLLRVHDAAATLDRP